MEARAVDKAANISKRRKWTLTALTVTTTLLLCLVVLEAVLRVMGVPFSAGWTPSENALAQFDPEIGWTYVPGLSHPYAFGPHAPVHFDGIGSRVPFRGAMRDSNRPAVIFVGGSYTMGHGLPYPETFVGRLDIRPDLPFQSVNLGVQAYGTDQSLLLLKRHMDNFRSVAVVYTFIDLHILRNATEDRRFIFPKGRFIGTKPLFAVRQDGSLYLAKRPVRYKDLIESYVWNWIRVAWFRRGPPRDLALTRALVEEMRDYVESRGARFIVVRWRQEIDLPGPAIFDSWEGPPPFEGMGLELIDTGVDPPPGWDSWFRPVDYHPDARAHLHVSELLLEKFRELGLVPAG